MTENLSHSDNDEADIDDEEDLIYGNFGPVDFKGISFKALDSQLKAKFC